MRRHYRSIAFAFSISLATLAGAQSNGTANPLARSPDGEVTFYNPWAAQQRGVVLGRGNVLDNTGIGRQPRAVQPVTPVPEPSQWAMMLAGLALVGFIVRRARRGDS